MNDLVRRTDAILRPDPRRVVSKPFIPGQEMITTGRARIDEVLDRIQALTDAEVDTTLARVLDAFIDRHYGLEEILESRFAIVADRVPDQAAITDDRRLLIGAYLSQEYAIEAAALFNPSMVAHPDQTGLAVGELRFVMSVRAVGEGHISSIGFRTGTVDADGTARFDVPSRRSALQRTVAAPHSGGYTITFASASRLDERIILPTTPAESNGVEDIRFTRFVDDDASVDYRGIYTAFDGTAIAPQAMSTTDFCTFTASTLSGPAATNKGMALFPRRIGGRLFALSRWDRETNSVTTSDDGLAWAQALTVQRPRRPWETVQLGNCGPPIETQEGWLVLTHGVGPMREYSIGALLLDLDDPTRVRGFLDEPLLRPAADEREGYVPNVVYSCGAMCHEDLLVLPYGCSDSSIRVALVDVPGLVARMVDQNGYT